MFNFFICRFSPPLVITTQEIEKIADIITSIFQHLNKVIHYYLEVKPQFNLLVKDLNASRKYLDNKSQRIKEEMYTAPEVAPKVPYTKKLKVKSQAKADTPQNQSTAPSQINLQNSPYTLQKQIDPKIPNPFSVTQKMTQVQEGTIEPQKTH